MRQHAFSFCFDGPLPRGRLHAPAFLSALLSVAGLSLGCVARGKPSRPVQEIKVLEEKPWGDPDHVIAEVNGKPITRGGFYQRVLERFGTARLLAGVIKEELFLQEARRRKITASAQEIDDKVEEVLQSMARDAGGEEELARIYRAEGVTLDDLRRDLEREVSTQLLIGKVTIAMRSVDDAMLRKYYQTTYSRKRYKTRHIAYSFVPRKGESQGEANRRKLEAFNRALRAADRIRKGADFAKIARAESDDSVTAPHGGDLGYIDENSPMDPALKKAILALSAGDVSDPVENPNGGYHIFEVTAIDPSQSYVDCEEKMRRELQEREPDLQEIEHALQELRSRSDVRVFDLQGASGGGERAADLAPAGTGKESRP